MWRPVLFWTPKLSLSPFPLSSCLCTCETARVLFLPFSHIQGTSDPGKDLHKKPIPLKSPKQDWSKTSVMLGMSFPVVDWGVKLCFQSQHYKWALLTDQMSAKSISLQRRWCSGSWKGHGLNHLQIIYLLWRQCHSRRLWGGRIWCAYLYFWSFWFLHCSQLSSQHISLLLCACGTFCFPAQNCLPHILNRGTFVWWEISFSPWDGDLYSQLNSHKFTSYNILQIKSREKQKMSFYWWVWWEADAQGSLEGLRAESSALGCEDDSACADS